jgi:hypothetical protein
MEGEEVWLTIPSHSKYLRTARLVAADAAGRAGMDCEEIEDFRIAVDELTQSLMTATDCPISISFGVLGSSVLARAVATRRQSDDATELDELSRAIVSSVADFFQTTECATEVGFSVMKRGSALGARL